MKKLLIAVVVLGLIAVVMNDRAQYFSAYNGLAASSYAIGDWASRNVSTVAPAQFGEELGKQALAQHVHVTQYSIDPTSVHLWAEADVTGTWLLGPYLAMSNGTPFNKAWGSSFVIKRTTTVSYR